MLLARRLPGKFQRAIPRFLSQNAAVKKVPTIRQNAQATTEPEPEPIPLKRGKKNWKLPDPTLERLTTRLCWLLRHGGPSVGLNIRPDGYVPLRDVSLVPGFHYLNIKTIQEVIAVDLGKRLHLKEEPGTQPGRTVWWIRATGHHTIKTVNPAWKEIESPRALPVLIYQANLSDWKTIRENGIWPEREDDLIWFVQSVSENAGLKAFKSSSMVWIYIDVTRAFRAGLSMYVTHTGDVVSEGDYRRCIPPHFFKKAVYVRWTKEVLLGEKTETELDLEAQS